MKSINDIRRRALARAVTHPVTPAGQQYVRRGGDSYTAHDARRRLLMLLDRNVADAGWRTISGVHVFIEHGKITKGPAALVGKTHAGAVEHHKQHGHDAADPHVNAEQAQRDRAAGKKPFQISTSEAKAKAVLGHDHPLVKKPAPASVTPGRVTGYRTSKGSTYEVHDDGRTTRTKAVHAGHDPSDHGKKATSETTYYVHPDHATALGMAQGLSAKQKGVVVHLDQVHSTYQNEKTGKWHKLDGPFPLSKTPTVGSSPLELWKGHHDEASGKTFYGNWHPGNEITHIEQSAPASAPRPAIAKGALSKAVDAARKQYVGTETREQSLHRYKLQRNLGIDAAKPLHGSERGHLADADQKSFEHFLDDEFEAKHGRIDENDHVALAAAGHTADYGHDSDDVIGPLVHEATTEAVRGKHLPYAPIASIERRLLEHHAAHGDETEDVDVDGEHGGEYASVAGQRNRTFHKTLPTEVKQYLQGRYHLRRLFKTTEDASQAGGADTLGQLGEGRYLSAIDRLGRKKIDRAADFAGSGDDPELRFLAHVYGERPKVRTSARRRKANREKRGRGEHVVRQARGSNFVHVPTSELQDGHSFTIHGEHFHVHEPEEGERVLLGPSHYPELPLDAAEHLPIDRGSLRRRKAIDTSPGDDVPFSRKKARARLIALSNPYRGEHGRFTFGPTRITGSELGHGLSDDQLREAAQSHLKELQGKPFHNAHTGRTITVSGRGRKKLMNSMADVRRAKLVPFIPLLIQHGRLKLSEEPTHEGRRGTMHRFEAGVNLEGKHHRVNFVVHEDGGGNWYYNHAIGRVRIKKARSGSSAPAPRGKDIGRQGGPSDKNIDFSAAEVKINPSRGTSVYSPGRSASSKGEGAKQRLLLLGPAIRAVRSALSRP